MNSHGQPFWYFVTAAVLAWYTTVTVYVAVRGLRDIRGMLKRLRTDAGGPTERATDPPESGVEP